MDNHPFRSFTSFFLYTVYIVFSFNPPFIRPFPACHVFFLLPQGLPKKKKKLKNLCALEDEESGAQIGLEEEHTKQEGGGL